MVAGPGRPEQQQPSMLQLASFAVLLLSLHQQQYAAQAAELPTQAAKPCIIAVGDGLTEGAFARKHDGWGLLLQERYVRKVSLWWRGQQYTAIGCYRW